MAALGHNTYIAVAKQTLFGTKVVAGLEFMEYLNHGIEMTIEEKIVQGINFGRVRTKRVLGARTGAGPIAWEVNVEDGIGHVLKGLLPNEVFVDDGAGNGGKHTFTVGDAIPPGYTWQLNGDTAVQDFFGGAITSLTLTSVAGELLQASAPYSFKNSSAGTPLVPIYTLQNPLVYHTAVVQIDGVGAEISQFALTIDTGLKVDRRIHGDDTIIQQLAGMYGVTGTFEIAFDNVTERDKFLNGTATKLFLDFTGPAIGTTVRRLRITLPTVFYNGETEKVPGADAEVRLTLPFVALKTGGGSPDELVEIQLDNSRRSVY